MKQKWIALPLFAFSLTLLGPGTVHALAAPASPAAGAQDRAWDAPPDEFRDVQRQGFHDGIEAAHHDADHHRHADADDHDAFRHPHVPRDQRDAYREGFRRGYERAMAHFQGDHDHN
ncbi:MAG: hypothetical protein WCC26_11265 [Terracidiphilus sp.]